MSLKLEKEISKQTDYIFKIMRSGLYDFAYKENLVVKNDFYYKVGIY